MIEDLKQHLGYGPQEIITYDLTQEKKTREVKWADQLSSYEDEYKRLLTPLPMPLPDNIFSLETDSKIKNMDELLSEKIKRRSAEYDTLMPTPPDKN
jgi:hypothetical protein